MGIIALKCPQCGADVELDETREFGFCTFCGTKVIQEKTVIEHRGFVKVDNSDELNNLYELARREKSIEDFDNAAKHYDLIRLQLPNDWESNFYATYCKVKSANCVEFEKYIDTMSKWINATLEIVKTHVNDFSEKKRIVKIIGEEIFSIQAYMLSIIKDNNSGLNFNQMLNLAVKSGQINLKFMDEMIVVFADDAELMSSVGIDLLKSFIDAGTSNDLAEKYAKTIKKYEFDYQLPEKYSKKEITEIKSSVSNNSSNKSSGGCYVATAVYGSYDCPEVWTLRRYRDNQLAKTWYGRLFIHTYYAISPTLVKWFGDTQWFKNMWKPKLDKMIDKLQTEGVENTPYQDRNW